MNFIDIISKPDATVQELTGAFLELQGKRIELQTAFDETYKNVISSHQHSLCGGDRDQGKKLTDLQKRLTDIDQKMVACQSGQDQIKGLLKDKIFLDFTARKDLLNKEFLELETEEDKLFDELISKGAELTVLYEKIKGASFSPSPRGDWRESPAKLEISQKTLSEERYFKFMDLVKEARGKEQNRSIEGKKDDIRSELYEIEMTIEEWSEENANEAVEGVLKKAGVNPVKETANVN